MIGAELTFTYTRRAPYGWTHCLTLSQAVLSIRPWIADPTRAAAIAATYVVAFRAAAKPPADPMLSFVLQPADGVGGSGLLGSSAI